MRGIGSQRAALLAAACVAVATGPAYCQTVWVDAPPVAAADLQSEVPDTTAGMVVYIDPVTGAILREPAPGSTALPLSQEVSEALSTSSAGLVQVQLPGGGVMIDLQGRFQSPMIATIDANGAVSTQHLDEVLLPYNRQ
jgi:hypothetical protein